MYRHCNSWISIIIILISLLSFSKLNGLFNFRIEYGKEIIRIINKISINATTDILELQEIIKVKKEGRILSSKLLKVIKNVISLEDIKATIIEYSEDPKKFMKDINKQINQYYLNKRRDKRNGIN